MNRRQTSTDFNPLNQRELNRKIAIHEAGHAAAIYLGNKQKQLPPVYFQIFINKLNRGFQSTECLCRVCYSCTQCFTKIEGGRLIHILPFSVEAAICDYSAIQKKAYIFAFEADIINLLVGPLAEANYVALRDNEPINPKLVTLNALHYYGGAADLEAINQYLDCFSIDRIGREKKLSELFLVAFGFIKNPTNWFAIMALAEYILSGSTNKLDCEEIMAVLDGQYFITRKDRGTNR
jgi:hypothetical protein